VESSGDVGSSIEILSPRVNQVDHILCNLRVIGLSGMVMDNSSIRSSSADSLKAQPFVVELLVPPLVKLKGCFVFIDFIEFGTPAPELGHGYSIDQMAPSETV